MCLPAGRATQRTKQPPGRLVLGCVLQVDSHVSTSIHIMLILHLRLPVVQPEPNVLCLLDAGALSFTPALFRSHEHELTGYLPGGMHMHTTLDGGATQRVWP